MRHLPKTAGIDLQFLNDVLGDPNSEFDIDLVYTQSHLMAADIHTKGFTTADKWVHARKLINVLHLMNIKSAFENIM